MDIEVYDAARLEEDCRLRGLLRREFVISEKSDFADLLDYVTCGDVKEGDFIRAVVGREGEEVVGWAAAYSYGEWRDHYMFVGVLVHPEHRRRGLGSALIDAAARLCPVDRKVLAAAQARRLLGAESRVEVACSRVGTT